VPHSSDVTEALTSHVTPFNAPLTLAGRLKLVGLVIGEGWVRARAAECLQVSGATVSKWVRLYQADGMAGLADRWSKPHCSPAQRAKRMERRIVALRFPKRCGPRRIGYRLRLPQSTVSNVLNRYRMALLGHVGLNTGPAVRKPQARRPQHANPGDLVHLDVKKLGRIPDGRGWRTLGNAGRKNKKKSVPTGYSCLHSANDDHSRVVSSEILNDEKKETAARGDIKHPYTRPYRPQTNGKIERFHRTLAFEWAYAHHYDSEQARAAIYHDWIHDYHHRHRPHTGIGGN